MSTNRTYNHSTKCAMNVLVRNLQPLVLFLLALQLNSHGLCYGWMMTPTTILKRPISTRVSSFSQTTIARWMTASTPETRTPVSSSSSGTPSAWTPPSATTHSASVNITSTTEEKMNPQMKMRQDIAAMRQEAWMRLQALEHQMDEFKHLHEEPPSQLFPNAIKSSSSVQAHTTTARAPRPALTTTTTMLDTTTVHDPSFEELREKDAKKRQRMRQQEEDHFLHKSAAWNPKETATHTRDSAPAGPGAVANYLPSLPRQPTDLLDGSQWKVVLNIGREPGTWMPPTWATSGQRLLIQLTVEFTDQVAYQVRDEFFQGGGVAGVKKLQVLEAHIMPRGVGVGQRALPSLVGSTGAYQVVRGQGPAGTDVVRFLVEMPEQLSSIDGDVTCPEGRIYGTCGYFAMNSNQQQHSCKDELMQEYHRTQRRVEELTLELEQQQQQQQEQTPSSSSQEPEPWSSFWTNSWEYWQKRRQLAQWQHALKELAQQVMVARQRQPEKSQLRLSQDGRVALSREGGVCCKVHKGLAVEYHILGRMEVARVVPHHPEAELEHDEFENGHGRFDSEGSSHDHRSASSRGSKARP